MTHSLLLQKAELLSNVLAETRDRSAYILLKTKSRKSCRKLRLFFCALRRAQVGIGTGEPRFPPSSGIGQPTIGRPFNVQAKGGLWPTRAFYAECAQVRAGRQSRNADFILIAAKRRYHHPLNLLNLFLHNPFTQPAAPAATATLGAKGPVKPKNPWAEGPSILRTFPSEPSEPFEPGRRKAPEPSHRRCVQSAP